MLSVFRLIVLALGFVACPAMAAPFEKATINNIRAFQKQFASGKDNPGGMVIGVIDETGHQVFSCRSRQAEAMNESSVFELGSVTKVFTVLLALELEREGIWDMSDPVRDHVPKGIVVPSYNVHEIALKNLARQDSGLPWHIEPPVRTNSGALDLHAMRRTAESYNRAKLFSTLETFTLPWEPGRKFQYSNVGMGLLGCLAEESTSKTFAELIEAHITAPLGMSSTQAYLNEDLQKRLVGGHFSSGEPGLNLNFKAMAGAGQMHSTVEDLLRFLAVNIAPKSSGLDLSLLKMQEIQHRDSPEFGLTAMPWFSRRVYQPIGSQLMGHGGGGFGYLAFVGFDTIQKRGVVILSNQMTINPAGVGWSILQGFPLTPNNIGLLVKRYTGVGFSLKMEPDGVAVNRVFSGSPAEKVGLPRNSRITKIGGKFTEGKNLYETLELLRGEDGDIVELTVFLPGSKLEKKFRITCAPFLTATGLDAVPQLKN